MAPRKNNPAPRQPDALTPTEIAVQALQNAKEATDALAAFRKSNNLSDTRARNVSRDLHEQIKILKAYIN